jgi:hypothetical protein
MLAVQIEGDGAQARFRALMAKAGFDALGGMDGVWAIRADGAPSYDYVQGRIRGAVAYLAQKAGAEDYRVSLSVSEHPPVCFDAASV